MYLDGSVLTAGALRLLQLLLNPFLTAGLQSAAYPSNGLTYNPMAASPAVAPPRQLSGGDLISLLATLGVANPVAAFSGSLGNGSPMGSFMSSPPPGSSGSPLGSFMSSPPSGSSGSPLGSFMSSAPPGSSGSPLGSFVSSPPSGSSGSPLGSFMSSPPPGPSGSPMGSASSMPGSMTVANMAAVPPLPYAPWLASQPAMPSSPNGPVFVPPSAVPSLLSPPAAAPSTPSSSSSGSLAAGALAVLEEAIAPYLNASSSSSSTSLTPSSADTASPMPMATLISVLGSFMSGIRVVAVNFFASVAVMGAAQLVRIVVQNLPIILNLLGLTRASMARVIVDGVTRAQCLERAACLLGQHASHYPSTPDVLRWLRSPDPATPEHPVWKAFRAAAEGASMQCDAFTC